MKKYALKIKVFLMEREVTMADIGRELGVSRQMISKFVKGQTQSQRIYNHFVELGCPPEYFEGRPEARKAA